MKAVAKCGLDVIIRYGGFNEGREDCLGNTCGAGRIENALKNILMGRCE
jgi:hypothetical protein